MLSLPKHLYRAGKVISTERIHCCGRDASAALSMMDFLILISTSGACSVLQIAGGVAGGDIGFGGGGGFVAQLPGRFAAA